MRMLGLDGALRAERYRRFLNFSRGIGFMAERCYIVQGHKSEMEDLGNRSMPFNEVSASKVVDCWKVRPSATEIFFMGKKKTQTRLPCRKFRLRLGLCLRSVVM